VERRAWELLRDRRCLGLKFRRQKILAGFIVDFYCAEHRLALELDGSIHDLVEARARDEERDAVLAGLGITILRIKNAELIPASLASRLQASIGRLHLKPTLPPSPPRGEGDRG
jgi:very-short-patch-repair endonuclease